MKCGVSSWKEEEPEVILIVAHHNKEWTPTERGFAHHVKVVVPRTSTQIPVSTNTDWLMTLAV